MIIVFLVVVVVVDVVVVVVYTVYNRVAQETKRFCMERMYTLYCPPSNQI